MSVAQAAAQAQAVVDRARSLFGSSPEPVTAAGAPLRSAAESVVGAGQQAGDLSGDFVDRHREFVTAQTEVLSTAGRTDTTLQSQIAAAAALTQAGARRLD